MGADDSPFAPKKQLRLGRRGVKSRAVRRLTLVAVVALSACTPTALTTTDFGIVLEGCRIPEACFKPTCTCLRATVQSTCMVCDPLTQSTLQCSCSADAGVMCMDPSQVCIGRAPAVCPGAGARCIPAGLSCSGSVDNEAPPQLVAAVLLDGGEPVLEPHCAYADDVCCPGTVEDMAVPDLAESD